MKLTITRTQWYALNELRGLPEAAHRERCKPGVTLALLHLEYLEANPGGYQHTAFCDRYRAYQNRRGLSMRQVHIAGDKMFVDYSGKKPRLVDPMTGEVTEVELFVAVLGASSYAYAEATYTQRVSDFIGSHTRAFAFFDGVTRATVPDNLKSGVTRTRFYEPTVQRSYEHMAAHYDPKRFNQSVALRSLGLFEAWRCSENRPCRFPPWIDLSRVHHEASPDLTRSALRPPHQPLDPWATGATTRPPPQLGLETNPSWAPRQRCMSRVLRRRDMLSPYWTSRRNTHDRLAPDDSDANRCAEPRLDGQCASTLENAINHGSTTS